MAYCTTQQAAIQSGLLIRVVDENVGTGDNSETDFDLDNDNVLAGSYALGHAASGSNSFTALTETTHYTISDPETGRIVLTGSGVTALGTDVLYATYSYTDNFSDDDIDAFITQADAEVNEATGRNWGTAIEQTDYFDGRGSQGYPTTNHPYGNDWDEPEFLMLVKSPITKISNVYFLQSNHPVSLFYNFDTGTSAYTDYTDNVNDTEAADFDLFDASPAANDIVYIGLSKRFLGIIVDLTTLGVGTTVSWEYYNGSSWTSFTPTDDTSGASNFTASGKFYWSMLSNWTKTSVNSSADYYWIRGTVAGSYSTDPVCSNMVVEDAINQVVHLRDIKWESWGKLSFVNVGVPNGTKNIRVNYEYGMATTPTLIAELSALYTSVRCLVNLSGGSYDDLTSINIGSKSYTVGEVYVNIREVIAQYKSRIEEIQGLMGGRADCVAI